MVRAQWDGVVELRRCGLLLWVGIGGVGFFLVVCGVAVTLELLDGRVRWSEWGLGVRCWWCRAVVVGLVSGWLVRGFFFCTSSSLFGWLFFLCLCSEGLSTSD